MVTITDYQPRKSEEGKEFFVLILQSPIEIIESNNGGLYATAKKVTLPTTFNENECKLLIGQQLPGTIKKIECEPYVYKMPQTGEEIIKAYRHEYLRELSSLEQQN